MEQFSLKTNWRLAERVFYNQGCKKYPHGIGIKGKEAIKSRPVPLRWNSEEEGDYTGRDPPWGVSGLSHILGSPVLESNTRKIKFPWLVGGLVRLIGRLWEAWTLPMRNTCTLGYSRSKVQMVN